MFSGRAVQWKYKLKGIHHDVDHETGLVWN